MKSKEGAKMDVLPACSDDGVGVRITMMLSGDGKAVARMASDT
jgi:hypothetical protein